MQSVINSVKGTALGVAEYLTPVLKVCLIIQIYDIFKKKINIFEKNNK